MTHTRSPLDASLLSYRLLGHETNIFSEGPLLGISIPALRQAELLFADDQLDLDQESLREVAQEGVELTVIVPLNRVGEMRRQVADYANFVQGWWSDEDGNVKFDTPRVP